MTGRIVDLIYDAVIDDTAMTPMTKAIADHIHADSGWILSGSGSKAGLAATGVHGIDPDIAEPYVSEWHRHDPWAAVISDAPTGTPALLERWVSRRAFLESRVYQDLIRGRCDILHCMAVLFTENDAFTSNAFQRARTAPAFDEEDRRRLAPFVPHLRRLATAQRRRASALPPSPEAMIGHPDPVILCDHDARPVHCSATGAAMLDAGQVLARTPQGRLSSGDPAFSIAGAIREAAVRKLPSVCRIQVCGEPHIVSIDPCGHASLHAVVTVRDVRAHARRVAREAAGLFDLTAAEQALLTSLLLGLTPEEHCAARAIAVSTARSQLRSVFAKTGTERQAELLLRVLETPTRAQIDEDGVLPAKLVLSSRDC